MSCRHDLPLGTCIVCYPKTGTLDPGDDPGEALDGPGAVGRDGNRLPMPSRVSDSIVPPMDARDILRVQRRTAFIELLSIYDGNYSRGTDEIDESLDRFFKAGIELDRRKRENG